jgi:hypothetical protein
MIWRIRNLTIAATVVSMGIAVGVSSSFAAPFIFASHYEENKAVGCPANGNGCRLSFTAVPAGKILQITRLSCKIFEEQRRVVHVILGLVQNNVLIRKQYFIPVFVSGGTVPGIERWAVNGEADFLAGPNVVPVVDLSIDLSTDSSIECQIVGRFVTAGSFQ